MTSDGDWLERSDWRHRSTEFGGLRAYPALVAIEYVAPVSDSLWRVWLALRPQRNVIGAVEKKWLRYPAIDWRRSLLSIQSDAAAAQLATYGAKLAWVCEHLLRSVPASELVWLSTPAVWFDLEGELRVGFTDDKARRPPEADRQHCDERSLVFVVGRTLLGLVIEERMPHQPVGEVIARCLEPDPQRRFASLQDVRDALRLAGGNRVTAPSQRPARHVFDELEQGIGYLGVAQATNALLRFERALALDPRSARARELQLVALDRGADVLAPMTPNVRRLLPWKAVAPVARGLEERRGFANALALYEQVRPDDADLAELELAMARCHFRLGNVHRAIDYAERVLRRKPAYVEALALRADTLLRTSRHAEALDAADAWLAIAPAEARAQYARGKSLLALGRPLDARDAFDRACLLDPKLLEAMLLRREVDRMIIETRATIGIEQARRLEVPERLAGVRTALADSLAAAIAWLRQPEYARDAEAQLVLGELHVFAGRHAEALAIVDAVIALGGEHLDAARLARGRCLLELGEPAQALEMFAAVEHVDGLEGRARALKALGRDDEAEALFRDYVARVLYVPRCAVDTR